jgi:CheY-like chemotaxis protein/two-component sensor histidine kinase
MNAPHPHSDNENPLLPLVLVVDDQPMNIQTIYQLLEDDYDIAMATSGTEALDYCKQRLPDLILLDVVMPGMDGYEVCRQLKADPQTAAIPVIFVTSQSDPADEAEGLRRGAVDYITKPVIDIVAKARVQTQLALKKARDDLARSQEELLQAEKMLALGRIVAGVAHELATPVGNAMVTASTLMEENHILTRKIKEGKVKRSEIDAHIGTTEECLTMVVNSLFRVSNLIETFKHVAIKDTGEARNKFMLHELASDIANAASFGLDMQKLKCDVTVDEGVQLDSYPGALGRALISLIQNVQIHAYPESGGIATISGTVVPRTGDNAQRWARITVADSGRGIPADKLKRIFDPFQSTQIGRGGPGLGLSITWALVTQVLGGRIEVESTVGKGSRFIITLPVTAPDSRASL